MAKPYFYIMEWLDDNSTVTFLDKYLPEQFKIFTQPQSQFAGRYMNVHNWQTKLLSKQMLTGKAYSSPDNIITCFRKNQFLEGLAMTISWGTMWRQNPRIYTTDLLRIYQVLENCNSSLHDEKNIDEAWKNIESSLSWSPVITSKTLHFMCRALGFDKDPPVAIDNKIILKRVWPALTRSVKASAKPSSWANGLSGYKRYMTFINYLRCNCYPDWSNTQIESTLFIVFYNK